MVDKYQTEALRMVYLRNDFYRKKFYFALSIYLLSLIVIAVLIGALWYLIKNPTRPLYFVTDQVGRLIQDIPRTSPNMSTEDASKWAIEAVEAAYSYDFVNYRRQLQNAQKYFMDYGWRTYMDGLKASNNLLALTQRKMVIIAKAVGKPKLLVEGILGGAYAWKFEIPVLVTYLLPPFDAKSRFQNPLLITVIVQRQSILNSYRGLGIVQMIGKILLSTQTGNLGSPTEASPSSAP